MSDTPLLSVAVPVYKVEEYLPECVDSILAQSYPNLEIILVDDGSPDGCGRICDEYAAGDQRVRVIHKENGGLSSARNAGIREAKGEYIAFVDDDDHIDPDMYEIMIGKAVNAGADMVSAGYFLDYDDHAVDFCFKEETYHESDIIKALIKGELGGTYAWNKIFRRECFNGILFPEGQNFEDVSTVYRAAGKCHIAVSAAPAKYHYIQRANSIIHGRNIKNTKDYWKAYTGRYEDIKTQYDIASDPEFYRALRLDLARAISLAWRRMYSLMKEDKAAVRSFAKEVSGFTKDNFRLVFDKTFGISILIPVFNARFNNYLSMAMTHFMHKMYCAVTKRGQI